MKIRPTSPRCQAGLAPYAPPRRLTPKNLWATAFRHLGIDVETTFPDNSGWPMAILPYGEPIRELI